MAGEQATATSHVALTYESPTGRDGSFLPKDPI